MLLLFHSDSARRAHLTCDPVNLLALRRGAGAERKQNVTLRLSATYAHPCLSSRHAGHAAFGPFPFVCLSLRSLHYGLTAAVRMGLDTIENSRWMLFLLIGARDHRFGILIRQVLTTKAVGAAFAGGAQQILELLMALVLQ
mmetsp:Transcript_25568/g.77636  ORF Transcript_25568/g.77636 Transcript_25568/m.77636 type:complete len:141 (+) Transcript_25568:826-1248(+)|eukprot:scaffold109780_cov27-Tisochrysis_lutea.AAC.2